MRDYVTKAIVLDKKEVGELDSRVILFTENFGKVIARAKSSRKITSKLSAHLQPLTRIDVRLMFSNSIQIVDALKIDSLLPTACSKEQAAEMLEAAQLVAETVSDQHPDEELWQLLSRGEFTGRKILIALGFNPEHAKCEVCGRGQPEKFIIRDARYICSRCLPRFARKHEYYAVQ